jgi:hypothetical protein
MLEKDNVFTEEKFNEMVDYVTNKQPELMNEEIKKENAHFEKIQASSLYGKIGDVITDRLGASIPAPNDQMTLYASMRRQAEAIQDVEKLKAFSDGKLSYELTEDEIQEKFEKGIKIISAESFGRGSGKTSMLREAIESVLGTTEGDFVIVDEPSMLPEKFEGFEPGKVVIIDSLGSMEELAKGQMRDFSLKALEMNEETNLPLTRTERRKQQRRRAKELSRQMKQEKKDTIHQTIIQADAPTKNNNVYTEEKLRGATTRIYIDDNITWIE